MLNHSIQRGLVFCANHFAFVDYHGVCGLEHHLFGNRFCPVGVENLSKPSSKTHHFFSRAVQFLIQLVLKRLALFAQAGKLVFKPFLNFVYLLLRGLAQTRSLALHLLLKVTESSLLRILVDLGNDVLCEVQYTVKLALGDVEKQTEIAGRSASIPDMCNRSRQLDVTHSLTPDPSPGYLDAALLAHDPLVAHLLVFAAVALKVLGRPEDRLAKQPVFLRSKPTIVDRLRFGHLTMGPLQNLFW